MAKETYTINIKEQCPEQSRQFADEIAYLNRAIKEAKL